MSKLGEAVVEVRPDLRPLNSGLAGAEREVKGFVSAANAALSRLGAGSLLTGGLAGGLGGLAATGGLAGAGLVGSGVEAAGAALAEAALKAADFGESLSKVRTTFGRDADLIVKAADDLADRFGLVKTATVDAATNIGLVGRAAGLSSDDSAKLGVEMAKLAADASSFFNVPLDVALEKVRSGLVGEAEPLRAFGVLLSEDAVKAEALRMGLVRNAAALTEQQKVLARASLIRSAPAMQKAAGDLERTIDSPKNALRRLQGDVENFKLAVGENLIGPMTQAVGLANDLGKAFQQTFGTAPIQAFGRELNAALVAARTLTTGEGLGSVLRTALSGPLGPGLAEKVTKALTGATPEGLQAEANRKAGAEGAPGANSDPRAEEFLRWKRGMNAFFDFQKEQRRLQDRREAITPGKLAGGAVGLLQGLLLGPAASKLAGVEGGFRTAAAKAANAPRDLGPGTVLHGAESFHEFAQTAALSDEVERQQLEAQQRTAEKVAEAAETLKELLRKAGDKAAAVVRGAGR